MIWCEGCDTHHRKQFKHNAGGYNNHGCRCDSCRTAWNKQHYEYELRLASKPIPDELHGTVNAYTNYRCRCDLCRAAHTQSKREYNERKKGEQGT